MKNLCFSFILFFSQKEFFSPSLKKAASFVQPFFHLIYLLLIFPKIDLAKSKRQVFSKTKSHSVTALIIYVYIQIFIAEKCKIFQLTWMASSFTVVNTTIWSPFRTHFFTTGTITASLE